MLEIKSGKTVQPSFFDGLDFYTSLPHITVTIKSYLAYGGDQPQQRTQAQIMAWQTLHAFSEANQSINLQSE